MRAKTRMFAALALILCGLALADGGFFVTEQFAQGAQSADQRAVIVCEDGRETILLQTAYEGPTADFAWIIPTPTQTTQADLTIGDPRVFSELYYLTEPRGIRISGSGEGGCGGCAGGSGGSSAPDYGGVSVWDQFKVGGYEVVVLSASDSTDLGKWLSDNGYVLPSDASPVLQHYVAKSWFFVAVKLQSAVGSAQANGSAGSTELKPLQISFDSSEPVFPMRISALSSSETQEVSVLLYVIAAHRMESSTYATREVNTEGWNGYDFRSFYERRFGSAMGSPPGLVVEYVGSSDGVNPWSSTLRGMLGLDPGRQYYVTRLRTYLRSGDMQDDIVFRNAPSDTEFNPSATYWADAGQDKIRLACLVFLLMGAIVSGVRRDRKRSWERGALLGLLFVVLVL